ncbi:hypothetical protein D3C85_1469980 [compost metagenome]
MQRAGLPTDGEGLAIFGVEDGHQRHVDRPRVVDQGATLWIERPTHMLAGSRRVADGQAQRVGEDVVGQGRDHLVVTLHGRPGADAIGVGAGARAHAIEVHRIACRHWFRIVG